MGLHHTNPVAQLKAAQPPQQQIKVMDLGDDMALANISFEPIRTAEGHFAVGIIATGGRISPIVGLQTRRVMIGVIPTMPLEHIKLLLDGKELPTDDSEAPVGPALVTS
jgi:hypothetical protein